MHAPLARKWNQKELSKKEEALRLLKARRAIEQAIWAKSVCTWYIEWFGMINVIFFNQTTTSQRNQLDLAYG